MAVRRFAAGASALAVAALVLLAVAGPQQAPAPRRMLRAEQAAPAAAPVSTQTTARGPPTVGGPVGNATAPAGNATAPAATAAAAPKDAAPKDAAPKDAAPKDAAPKDAAPKDAAPKDAAPKDAAPKDAAPKGAAPKDAKAKDEPKKTAYVTIGQYGAISEWDSPPGGGDKDAKKP
ncbi:hypothetical protein Rsub_02104 [Raphidocelis subcapitata]|uniref:Uncharacterized protein n=1 Tax=Raphidocelis subcapitata TaxID=307507 RepID=A0A2V0NWB0_9CHLO|nr:hypothetical protein Rsub_02104 [Raphidocelis subcapitata]|eukprot:GBF89227.1 hypothetical protein Rsub_02104 [Raphidocelis subcapitata]